MTNHYDLSQVTVAIISFRWNFLTEGVINSLPWNTGFNLPITVIHVAKDHKYASLFWTSHDKDIRQVIHHGGTYHSSVLNEITFNPPSWLNSYKWVLLLDHDVFFHCHWQELSDWIAETINAHHDKLLIAATPFPGKVFNTNPLMLLKVDMIEWLRYPVRWNAISSIVESHPDTGQPLGALLMKDNALAIYNVHGLPIYQHIGSAWMECFKNYDDIEQIKRSEYCRIKFINFYKEKLFNPQPYEVDLMRNCSLHKDIIKECEPKRFNPI